MSDLAIILGMGACTFLLRYVPLALFGKRVVPESLRTSLTYIPPAMLAAIVVPAVLMPDSGHVATPWTNPYLLGGLVTLVIGLCSDRFLLVSGVGTAAFFLLRWLLGG